MILETFGSDTVMLIARMRPIGVRRIGIFGHVGNENLGDEASISAVIQNIRRRLPDAQIYGFTSNPEDTQKRHHIPAFPIRRTAIYKNELGSEKPSVWLNVTDQIKIALKAVPVLYGLLKRMRKLWNTALTILHEPIFLIQCYRNLKEVDLLIIAGSQQLIDYVGGPWAFPYTLCKWVLLASAAKAKVAFVSVGAGPIRSPLGKFFAYVALRLSSYRSYRDGTSQSFVETLGVSAPSTVFPDLVYSLAIEAPSSNSVARESQPIVGINPVPFSDNRYWLGASERQYEMYIRKLAEFASWLIESGHQILFFPMQLRLDPPVIADIKSLMTPAEASAPNVIEKPVLSFEDLLSAICMTEIVVATRFHGIVISYVLNKPVLGIAYQPKSRDVMVQMGQSDYVVDIESFDTDSLKTRFALLKSRSACIKQEIKQRKSMVQRALQSQYDEILSVL